MFSKLCTQPAGENCKALLNIEFNDLVLIGLLRDYDKNQYVRIKYFRHAEYAYSSG